MDIITMQPQTSSNILSIGYDAAREILFAQFVKTSETIYCFYDVPEQVKVELLESNSVGSAFHKLIKGRFETESYSIEECEEFHGIVVELV